MASIPSPADLVARARAALEAERPQAALDLLEPLARAHPDAAEIRLQLARAQAAAGDAAAARASFDACLRAAPGEPVVWMECALFEARHGRGGTIVARARKAGLAAALVSMVQAAGTGQGARAHGTGAASRADLAVLSKAAGDLRAVEARAIPLLKARPGAVVWGLLAQARLDAGKTGTAVEAFRQGLRLEPYAVDLRLGLARALMRQGDLAAALAESRRAAQVAPLLVAAQLLHGRVSLQAGLDDRAMAVAEAMLAQAPNDGGVLALAAQAAARVGRTDDAIRHARTLAAKAPEGRMLLAGILGDAGDAEGALRLLDEVLAERPADAAALASRGQLRQTAGDAAGAEADLRASLDADPGDGVAARALAYGTKLAADDPALARMRAGAARPGLAAGVVRSFDYALARALAPHDAAAAARHLAAANASVLRSYPYDPAQLRVAADRATGARWPAVCAAGDAGARSAASAAPIFVTGLPRSGTTLVESILAAHPQVVAGGELAVLQRALAGVDGDVDGAALTAAGEAYAQAADRRSGGTRGDGRMTDKSIFTYNDIGTVRAILPNARIVVVTRDPRDTGLSLWRNQFRDGTHRYAATQEGIAEQIALFTEVIAFWEAALPGGFHRIAYEDLLDDPESRSRALLDAVGLDWDDRALEPHAHAGPVRTLSFAQVRQPIYRSSRGGWERSAAEIAPLIAALEARGLLPD